MADNDSPSAPPVPSQAADPASQAMDPASQGAFTIPDLGSADLPSPPPSLREDQVQNAVAFLSHPKVRSSSEQTKRSFLEGKGLTAAEIDEGFRRVGDLPASSFPAQPAAQSPAPSAVPGSGAGPQPPAKPFPTANAAAVQPLQLQQPALVVQPAPQPVRWTQVLLGAGVLAAGAYGLKQLCYPTVLRWYETWAADRKAAIRPAEPSEAAKVAEALQAQNAELRETVAALQAMVKTLDKAKAPAPPFDSGLSVTELRQELRNFGTTLAEFNVASPPQPTTAAHKKDIDELKSLLRSVASQSPGKPAENAVVRGVPVPGVGLPAEAAIAQPQNGIARLLAFGASSAASPAPLQPQPAAVGMPAWQATSASSPASWTSNPLGSTQSPAPFSASPSPAGQGWAHAPATVVASSGTAAPLASAPVTGPFTAQQAPPTPGSLSVSGGHAGNFAVPLNADLAADVAPSGLTVATSSPDAAPGQPPHPASYMEVLEMLERGETPPGIRTDIADQPPNPNQPAPGSRLQPRPKPWERAHAGGTKLPTPFTEALAVHAGAPGAPSHSKGVTITELTDDAPAATSTAGGRGTGGGRGDADGAPAWRPPAVPQPSIKLGNKARSTASVSSDAGSTSALSERA